MPFLRKQISQPPLYIKQSSHIEKHTVRMFHLYKSTHSQCQYWQPPPTWPSAAPTQWRWSRQKLKKLANKCSLFKNWHIKSFSWLMLFKQWCCLDDLLFPFPAVKLLGSQMCTKKIWALHHTSCEQKWLRDAPRLPPLPFAAWLVFGVKLVVSSAWHPIVNSCLATTACNPRQIEKPKVMIVFSTAWATSLLKPISFGARCFGFSPWLMYSLQSKSRTRQNTICNLTPSCGFGLVSQDSVNLRQEFHRVKQTLGFRDAQEANLYMVLNEESCGKHGSTNLTCRKEISPGSKRDPEKVLG